MRTLRLLNLAAEAEGLRLRRTAQLTVRRIVWYAAGGLFGAIGFIMLHLAAWYALEQRFSPALAALIVAGADILFAAVFVLVLGRSSEDSIVNEAKWNRQRLVRAAIESNPLSEGLRALTLRTPAAVLGGLLVDGLVKGVRRRR